MGLPESHESQEAENISRGFLLQLILGTTVSAEQRKDDKYHLNVCDTFRFLVLLS